MADGEFQPNWFSKPGDTLGMIMARRDLSPSVVADGAGCDLGTVMGVLSGRLAIDRDLAIGFASAVGGSPAFWERRQSLYDDALARVSAAIPRVQAEAWIRKLPVSEMSTAGWIEKSHRLPEKVRACLAYFGVNDAAEWERRYASITREAVFRTSPSFESKVGALSAWLRQGEIKASVAVCAPFDLVKLRGLVPGLRGLTKAAKAPAYFLPRLVKACASAGVAVVCVRAPSGCRASGAVRFTNHDKAMLLLSFRHLSDDHFWFTFFHEVGHLLLHGRDAAFVVGENTSSDQREIEANRFSASTLVPPERQAEMMALRARTDSIVRFAVSIGVSPGIVVGQMQHSKVIGPDQLNFLKRRYTVPELVEACSQPVK